MSSALRWLRWSEAPGGKRFGMNQASPPGGHVTDHIMHIHQGRGRLVSSPLVTLLICMFNTQAEGQLTAGSV